MSFSSRGKQGWAEYLEQINSYDDGVATYVHLKLIYDSDMYWTLLFGVKKFLLFDALKFDML